MSARDVPTAPQSDPSPHHMGRKISLDFRDRSQGTLVGWNLKLSSLGGSVSSEAMEQARCLRSQERGEQGQRRGPCPPGGPAGEEGEGTAP